MAQGAGTRMEIAARTGLSGDVVDAALEHLQRMGRIVSEQLSSGCPDEGCGTCPSGKSDGSAGCGSSGARGPVLLRLSQRPEGPPDSAEKV
ncbi:hypothetical protein EII42_10855 [Tessaracoccus sp. OH4464_COT-324]|nr:hypothetical protein EII42_10855 [Tessaracoccus sp. OH4464_COT-324]